MFRVMIVIFMVAICGTGGLANPIPDNISTSSATPQEWPDKEGRSFLSENHSKDEGYMGFLKQNTEAYGKGINYHEMKKIPPRPVIPSWIPSFEVISNGNTTKNEMTPSPVSHAPRPRPAVTANPVLPGTSIECPIKNSECVPYEPLVQRPGEPIAQYKLRPPEVSLSDILPLKTVSLESAETEVRTTSSSTTLDGNASGNENDGAFTECLLLINSDKNDNTDEEVESTTENIKSTSISPSNFSEQPFASKVEGNVLHETTPVPVLPSGGTFYEYENIKTRIRPPSPAFVDQFRIQPKPPTFLNISSYHLITNCEILNETKEQ